MASGHNWKHGWIPLTPGAVRSKNHGRKPGGTRKSLAKKGGTSAPRTSATELTPARRREIMRQVRAREDAIAAPAKAAAAAAGFTGPPKKKPKPYRKSAMKAKKR